MPDYLISRPLTDALPHLDGPDAIHRFAMSFLPDLHGLSRRIRGDLGVLFRLALPTDLQGLSHGIRADLGVLFRLALPTDLGGIPGQVTLRFRAQFPIKDAAVLDAPSDLQVGDRFTVRVVAEKRRQDENNRTRTRPVLDEEAHNWATGLLKRHGIEASDVVVSPRWTFGRPPQRQQTPSPTGARWFTVRDLTATVTALTPECRAYTAGIGRGKAFGHGMPIIIDHP